MALILNIDTATDAGSVCLSLDGNPLKTKTTIRQQDQAALIVPSVQLLLEECGVSREQLQAIAISGGPGSYTGLRVAAATAKGWCYAWGIPLIAVGTLEMMSAGMKTLLGQGNALPPETYFCPVIDARRMEVFTALYDMALQPVISPAAVILQDDFLAVYHRKNVVVFGTGKEKTEKLLAPLTQWQFHDFISSATYLAPLAEEAFQHQQFQDLAYFEPYYYKAFYTPQGLKTGS